MAYCGGSKLQASSPRCICRRRSRSSVSPRSIFPAGHRRRASTPPFTPDCRRSRGFSRSPRNFDPKASSATDFTASPASRSCANWATICPIALSSPVSAMGQRHRGQSGQIDRHQHGPNPDRRSHYGHAYRRSRSRCSALLDAGKKVRCGCPRRVDRSPFRSHGDCGDRQRHAPAARGGRIKRRCAAGHPDVLLFGAQTDSRDGRRT